MNILLAIAALCSSPSAYEPGKGDTLSCQKYYIRCLDKTPGITIDYHLLKECVLKKKFLGGPR